ncbi:L-idonate 5-dehydrogenase [Oceanicola sp. D3]|uniref:L-idonate 5-dehydrogenase n=1 Tax=Oceanicola sp. D3 TaxID=2587163 RepID=UPI00111ED034|nr:L-idonate 5-dehydrogenase [Oceanicola sp. D3]QDC11320.1 L-idonate 5-dehydrogenase [Oceanicola sp. D3]
MKALFAHGAHDLRLEDCNAVAPGPGEVALRMARGGICGSDLHYYHNGGFGTVKLREPMILGHEVAGEITALGEGVEGLAVGDLVAVSPSRPCGTCEQCLRGLPNQCLNMRFYGSAMPFPHIQGAFREELTALASQCVKAEGLSAAQAAMAEPLAVCLHATRQAGDLLGKRVLITGCGPIGQLCIRAVRQAGAGEIVATDIFDPALEAATTSGADTTVNTAADINGFGVYVKGKGYFDVAIECSGAAIAVNQAVVGLRPRGTLVQLGLGGSIPVPLTTLTTREISLKGSFRFHEEFATAIALMQKGLIDVTPLITHSFPLADYAKAFITASDKSRAMKVQLEF